MQRAFRRFYIPAMLSSFWLAVAAVADSVFVGNGVGSAGLAAISLGQPVYLFYNILSYGFSIGGSIHYASRLAEGRAEEIFVNIAHYAYVPETGTATVSVTPLKDGVSITFTDSGMAYNPLAKEDPDITLSAEERKIGGLGIYMVKQSVDEMHYAREDGKNVLTILKKF